MNYFWLLLGAIHFFLVAATRTDLVVNPCLRNGSSINDSMVTASNCIDEAFDNITSNTALFLLPGTHHLHDNHSFTALSSIMVYGGLAHTTVIRCGDNAGLSFIQVSNLTIANLQIEGCGFAIGSTLIEVTGHVLPAIGDSLKVGVLLVYCEDAQITNVSIQQTPGIALLSYNTMGTFELSEVSLTGNHAPDCSSELNVNTKQRSTNDKLSAKGSLILYIDFIEGHPTLMSHQLSTVQFKITDSTVSNNSDCSPIESDTPSLHNSIGGGGVSLILAQRNFTVNAVIEATVFERNNALSGSAMAVFVSEGVTGNNVTFQNCNFTGNGFILSDPNATSDQYLGGGGVAIFGVMATQEQRETITMPDTITNNVHFINSTFLNNSGLVGGALEAVCFHRLRNTLRLSIQGCLIEDNVALAGAGLFVHDEFGSQQGWSFELSITDSTFKRNSVNSMAVHDPLSLSGIVSVSSVEVILGNEVKFEHNSGSPLVLRDSSVKLIEMAKVDFVLNRASHGGSLRLLSQSFIVLSNNATIRFINNTALVMGGAIFIDTAKSTNVYLLNQIQDPCFLHFESTKPQGIMHYANNSQCSPNINTTGVKIIFAGNISPTASLVFGSTLRTCPWATSLIKEHPGTSVYNILTSKYSNIFDSDKIHQDLRDVATKIAYFDPPESIDSVRLSPGEVMQLNIISYDLFDQRVPNDFVYFESGNPSISAYLEQRDLVNPLGSILQLRGPNDYVTASIEIRADNSPVRKAGYVFNLKPCELGFEYDEDNRTCVCSDALMNFNILCNASNASWTVPSGFWVGPQHFNNTTSLVIMRCFEDVCSEGETTVYPGRNDYSVQCAAGYNRMGLGCGQCKKNFSLILGSNRCERCYNSHLFLIAVFAFLGILTIVIILLLALLNCTISDGYINGVLFYANIINYYIQIIVRKPFPFSIILTPLSLISLNLGVPICFHDGLDPLLRSFYELLFPFYLVIVVIVINFLPRCFKCPQKLGLSNINTLATVLLIIYSALSMACFRIIDPTIITNMDTEDKYTSWAVDPSLNFFSEVHGLLTLVAIVIILVYVIPFPLILLFPKQLYKLKFTRKFHPLYDAFWNPFKEKYRFWLGLRLLARQVPFFAASFVHTPLDTFVTSLFLLVVLHIQLIVRPFKGDLRNIIDSIFITLLILLFLGPVIFQAERVSQTRNIVVLTILGFASYELEDIAYIYSVVFLLCGYILAVGILVVYIFNGFKKCYARRQKCSESESIVDIDKDFSLSQSEANPLARLAEQSSPTFSLLREPLLDDGSLMLEPIN